MSLYQTLSLLIGSWAIFVAIFAYFRSRFKANEKKTKAVALGVQALLRDRLIDKYNKFEDLGYAPIWAKQNFENMWTQYHNLGVNGVMDEMYHKFIALPTEPPEKGAQ